MEGDLVMDARNQGARVEGIGNDEQCHNTDQVNDAAKTEDVPIGHSYEGSSIEHLLSKLVDLVSESNTSLREIIEHNQREVTVRAENERREKKKDNEIKRQTAGTTSLQIMSSGSIIAVFIASLDVALLSYAHDVLSDRGGDAGGTPVKFTDKFAISCWFVSLLLAIIVVLAGSFFTFAQSWAIFMDVANTMGARSLLMREDDEGDERSEKKTSQRRSEGLLLTESNNTDAASMVSSETSSTSALSDIDTQVTVTLASVAFNAVVVPSLMTLVVGIFVFAWAEQPRLTSISLSAFAGFFWFLTLMGCCIALVSLALQRWRERAGKEGEGV